MHFTLHHPLRRAVARVVFVALALFILTPLLVGAETQTHSERPAGMPVMPIMPAPPEGSVNCFDYYRFGSVAVDVVAEPRETFVGIPIHFWGKLKNENEYPIVDAQVYMKVFYKDPTLTESEIKQNGYSLVAFEKVADHMTIPALGERDISFEWTSSKKSPKGEYFAAFFVTSAERFNLLGLTFTDDVTGNKMPITLKHLGEVESPLQFDKNSVTLNDKPYQFASYPPHFAREAPVTLNASITNSVSAERTAKIEWSTTRWDALRETNVVDKKTTTVTLGPKETKVVTYTPPVVPVSVTLITATLIDGDAKSILNVRYVRDGVEEVRLNFPSLTRFPLTAGESVDLFSCVHSTNIPLVEDGELTLTLADGNGTTLHTYKYAGGITSAMMGLKDSYVPEKNSDSLLLTATLSQKGAVIDAVTVRYDCADIDPSLCSKEANVADAPEGISDMTVLEYILASLGALLCIAVILWYRGYRKNAYTKPVS